MLSPGPADTVFRRCVRIATHPSPRRCSTARARYEKSYLYYRGFSRMNQTFHGTEEKFFRESAEAELPR